MNKSRIVKIVIFVPESHTDIVRDAMGKAGAGKIGNYSFCSFSSQGIGRFRPEAGAHPTVGEIGKLESVAEVRIETICERDKLTDVLKAIKEAHPYEEAPLDIYPTEEI